MEHSDCFLGTVDFETYLLIDKLESIYFYYTNAKNVDFDEYTNVQDLNLVKISTRLVKLSDSQLHEVFVYTQKK